MFISPATFLPTGATGDDGTVYYRGNVDPANLISGINLVAVHVAQNDTTSSDTSFDLMLWGQSASAGTPPWSVVNAGTQIVIAWAGNGFTLQSKNALDDPAWTDVTSTSPHTIALPAPGSSAFFRLRQ